MEDMEKVMKAGSEQEDDFRSSAFLELKSYCLQLLELVQMQNPKNHASVLPALLRFLRNSPPATLQPFFDYTLFPLLLLFDVAIECRSMQKVGSEDKFTMSDVSKTCLKVSDNVAEGVVKCLEELLRKCRLKSVDQMVVLLKKLTYGALLSPSEASEEFREGIILCFKALLQSLYLCSDESCSCKQIFGLLVLSDSMYNNAHLQGFVNCGSESEVCLLAFLRSQTASAAIGHWLSLLLKTADTEAARGHRGSARLRVEAFKTLRLMVAKVGTADALAFFLPGVVSQFSRVLHSAKTMISGAAGSVEAVDQAIRGLAEYIMIVLQDDANAPVLGIEANSNFNSSECKSPVSLMEELRHLAVKAHVQNKDVEDVSDESGKISSKTGLQEVVSTDFGKEIGSLHVNRTKDWIDKTSANVNKLLNATFPHICMHPSQKVRKGLVEAIIGLLSKCHLTLWKSRLMLLECLCALVVDDSDDVSTTAQEFLEGSGSEIGKPLTERDAAMIFSRHIEKLPKVVLGNEEALAVLHAQKLLAIIYYSGPHLVADHLQSPVGAAKFLDVFAACLGHNSMFCGSLDDIISTRPSTTSGYLPSLAELKSGTSLLNYGLPGINAVLSEAPKRILIEESNVLEPVNAPQKKYELPHMPPWFGYVGSFKLYEPLAGILRLVGLSLVTDCGSEGLLSQVTEILLGYLHKLVSELRKREFNKESWQSWYDRTGSGQLLRQASTAACMLNEIIFGLSDQAINYLSRMFHKSTVKRVQAEFCKLDIAPHESVWKMPQDDSVRSQLLDSIGRILHEYLSAEVWSLPIEQRSANIQSEFEDISLYVFQDTAMLHEEFVYVEQVIIDGLGIFNICLGREFASSGFLHSSLYLLLENLSSLNYQVRNAADSVLHIFSATSGYATVGQLVLEYADYVIDSICRQLRHLDLNQNVPNVLASMLSYIGVAHKILPLLEEPMLAVSLELEILGRHQHPDLTISFLKAVAEITKTSKHEACLLPPQAGSFCIHVKSEISNSKESTQDQWEAILFKLNDFRRYRRTVGSIAGSCITAATPLTASLRQETCLVALDIIEGGMLALAKVEEAYKHESETKEAIEELLELQSLYQLKDTLDAAEGTDENRLLPAMNKIWPFLVACIQSRNPVAVRRCLNVVSNLVQICGGDFFSRRFYTDGAHFWKLLTTSPFQKASVKDEQRPLQLPYRNSIASEDSVAEISNLKVQIAVLNMIADLSLNKRSAPALELVIKKLSGLVVGIACSSVVGLRDASLNALHGLASIDSDLVWLLLADIYYTAKTTMLPPPRPDLPEISELLPPLSSPKEYIYVQYGGQSYGFDIDFTSVDVVFKKLYSQDFS